MSSLKFIIFFVMFNLLTIAPAISESNGVWNLWVVPNKRTINQGERVEIDFGLTGYGNIDQTKLKIVVYSEQDTLIQRGGEEKAKYDTYAMAFNEKVLPDRFTKSEELVKNSIILISDHNSRFGKLYLWPQSSGNKRLTLNATFVIPDDGWHSAKYEFDYHVNSWVEEHQTTITIVSIIFGLFSISFLPSLGMRLLDRGSKTIPPESSIAGSGCPFNDTHKKKTVKRRLS
jgi:hypothetical protein